MPRPPRIPAPLRHRPFTREEALTHGMTSRQLQGRQFRRLHPGVWVWTGHDLSAEDEVLAARLAVPSRARVSHVTRIQQLGLDTGPRRPVHLTIAGDHHLTLDGVFLHRSEVLPPSDDVGVSGAAAFIGFAATARLIDLVGVGDWLLRRGHMTMLELRELARRDRWRPGAPQALWVSRYLDGGAASLPESHSRAFLEFAGLPRPGVNVLLGDDPDAPTTDLWLEEWRTAVEYEGAHHFTDPEQVRRDIGRYAWMRRRDIAYVQITRHLYEHPRALVLTAYSTLVDRGYTGPRPEFGRRWHQLFARPPVERSASNLIRVDEVAS